MTRAFRFWAIWIGLSVPAWTQTPAQAQKKPPVEQQEQEPPEEDASLKPKDYSFNPLQAEKELTVGGYYLRKGNFKAAAQRFREATRWNPGLADAYFRLGEAEEKLKDKKAAREAFAKYLELSPEGKDAAIARRKTGQNH